MPKYAGVLKDLKDLYKRYSDCRGRACAADLPKKYRLSPAKSRQLTDHEQRSTRIYFGD